jgi:hypothetical protein
MKALKIPLAFIAALGLVMATIIICKYLFVDFDGKVMAGWWGCMLYTYLTEKKQKP